MLQAILTPELNRLQQAFKLSGFDLRIVGGAVRDLFLGVTPKDIDLCTNATPDEMIQISYTHNITAIPTGLSHGTLTYVVNHIPFEVTTLRIDVETDGRHAKVEWTRSFEQDAARRDLTFNAMSIDFDGKLYDYFDGISDLKENHVRFVGNPRDRVVEDYLRILRYFRFAARFDASMNDDTLKIFSETSIKNGLKNISTERVWLEMSKLFISKGRTTVLSKMFDTGILETIGINNRPRLYRLQNNDDAIAGLSTFVLGGTANKIAEHWKLSTAERDKLIFLANVSYYPRPMEIEDWLVEGKPRDWVVSLALMSERKDLIDLAKTFEPKVFPVGGKDLISLGIKPGPNMGVILQRLKTAWFKSRFTLNKFDLLKMVNV